MDGHWASVDKTSQRAADIHSCPALAALTLAVLLITGSGSQYVLPLAVAVLSELVPELRDRFGDWADWGDILQNLGGIGIAMLVWTLVSRWHRRRRVPSSPALFPGNLD